MKYCERLEEALKDNFAKIYLNILCRLLFCNKKNCAEKDHKKFSFQTLEKIISNLTVAKNLSREFAISLVTIVK